MVSAFPALSAQDPNRAIAWVAFRILWDRAFVEIRTKRNLSYQPDAGLGEAGGYVDHQGFLYATSTDPTTTMRLMYAEALRLSEEPMPARRLAATKEQIVTSYLMETSGIAKQADALADAVLLQGDIREARRFIDRVRAVTNADIAAFGRKYLRNLQTILLGDPASFEATAAGLPDAQ